MSKKNRKNFFIITLVVLVIVGGLSLVLTYSDIKDPIVESPKNITTIKLLSLIGTCGDTYCQTSIGETSSTCAIDCFAGNTCGDGICQGGAETHYNQENKDQCPIDCYKPAAGKRSIAYTYRTYEEAVNTLLSLEIKYPTRISHEIIGKSTMGKDMYMFKVGKGIGVFMFDGGVHGGEDCGREIGIKFIEWVVTSNDADAVDTYDNSLLMFIPTINPDSTRRTNMRRSYPDGTLTPWGVDMNRAFAAGWTSGSKDPLSSYDYGGKSPGNTEPETQAITNVMNKYKPNVYLNTHCGMHMLQYDNSNTNVNAIVTSIGTIQTKYGVNTLTSYPPSQGVSGGFVAAQGTASGAKSSWIFEISTWGELPIKLDDYNTKYYNLVLPVYLAMAKNAR